MFQPKRIKILNLMSYKDVIYEFKNGIPVMVFGVNNSDEGQESNGSGKSTLLEAISVSILGSALRSKSTKDTVMNGEEFLEVEFDLENSVTQKTLSVYRKIFSNTKSSIVKIWDNGNELTDLVDVNAANQYILDTIGISREDLLNYFLISKEKYTSFLSSSDTKKKDVIGRFSQSNLIDPVFENIKLEVAKSDSEISVLELDKSKITGKIEILQDQINNFDLNAKKEEEKEKVKALNDKLTYHTESKKITEVDIKTLGDEITFLNNELGKIKIPDISKIKSEFNENTDIIKKSNDKNFSSQQQAKEMLQELNVQLRGVISCPKCDHKFNPSKPDANINTAPQDIEELDKFIIELGTKINDNNSLRSLIQSEYDKASHNVNNIKRKRSDINNSIRQKMIEKDGHINKIKSIEEDELRIKDALRNREEISSPIPGWGKQIDEFEKDLIKIQQSIDKVALETSEKRELEAIFLRFKSHLANKAIASIEAHLNEYLGYMKSNLTVLFRGFTMTRTGKLREKISLEIMRDGMTEGDFSKFSSGEKARIEVACILALQKLININSTSENGGLDLCFLDEVIESVDNKGIEGIMASLSNLNKTIVVITHSTFNSPYPHILKVIKENGESRFE